MSQSRITTVDFGIEVAQEFVSAYGPVSLMTIQENLDVQCALNLSQTAEVLEYCVNNDWMQYDGMDLIYWNKFTDIEIGDLGRAIQPFPSQLPIEFIDWIVDTEG